MACLHQWSLLQTLAASNEQMLDLNATPRADSHPNKGITLAYLLAHNQQWDLLQILAVSNEQVLDLFTTPQADSYPKKLAVAQLLISAAQWQLLKKIIEANCKSHEALPKYLETLLQWNLDSQFNTLIVLIMLEQQELIISKLIVVYDEEVDARTVETLNLLKDALILSESYIKQIDKHSSYYRQAQKIKAHLIMQINSLKLPQAWSQQFLAVFHHNFGSGFSQVKSDAHQFLLIEMNAIIKAGASKLGTLLLAEQLKKNEQLRTEIKNFKKTLAQTKQLSLNDTQPAENTLVHLTSNTLTNSNEQQHASLSTISLDSPQRTSKKRNHFFASQTNEEITQNEINGCKKNKYN